MSTSIVSSLWRDDLANVVGVLLKDLVVDAPREVKVEEALVNALRQERRDCILGYWRLGLPRLLLGRQEVESGREGVEGCFSDVVIGVGGLCFPDWKFWFCSRR